ncbi:jg22721 [Pararge aegeria aegeria]|uniref:Jg22721 protein n=1 Tax=Pararge aegeria aegeria TaxID=348720 RepID=A0A8S4QTL5_9NEOP|nr:jg22721 [Pararge aegeria aegeria]
MDTIAPRRGTVIMSDSYRLKPHVVGPRERFRTLPRHYWRRAAPVIAGPPLGHTKMSLQLPKAHREHKVRLPTRGSYWCLTQLLFLVRSGLEHNTVQVRAVLCCAVRVVCLVLRFRQGPVAVAADIKEMFLRIVIREEDRLRFLWKENKTDTLEINHPHHINLGDHDKYGKTLGMIWQTNNDALRFTVNLRNTPDDVTKETRPPTKREVASAVMSVFDPLGLATPVLIQGKTL